MNNNYHPTVSVRNRCLAFSLSRQASNFFKFPRGVLIAQIDDAGKNIYTIFCDRNHIMKSKETSLHDVMMFLEGARKRESAKMRRRTSRNVARRNAAYTEIAALTDNYTRVRVSLSKARQTIEDLTVMSDNYAHLCTKLEEAR